VANKSTCRLCDRTVHLVPGSEGTMVAVDPEMIAVVPTGRRSGDPITAHRVHAELCETYRNQAAAEKLRREMRDYNRSTKRNKGL